MKILFAPFAARPHSLNGHSSPKDYPWPKELAELLEVEHELIQVGGDSDKQVVKDFRKNPSFLDLGKLINESDTAICVDSYLQHYYWHLGKRAVVLWSISDPGIFGHELHLNLLKDRASLRPNQFDLYYTNEYNNEAFYKPSEVVEALKNL